MSGKYDNGVTVAGSNVTIFTAPAGLRTVNINVVNTTGASAKVRIGLSTTGTPTVSEWIEYDRVLFGTAAVTGGGVVERTGIALSAGENIVVFSDTSGCAVRVHGYDEV